MHLAIFKTRKNHGTSYGKSTYNMKNEYGSSFYLNEDGLTPKHIFLSLKSHCLFRFKVGKVHGAEFDLKGH